VPCKTQKKCDFGKQNLSMKCLVSNSGKVVKTVILNNLTVRENFGTIFATHTHTHTQIITGAKDKQNKSME
jgi:hypothetical protein